jgi:putative hydrolase of the HAD superfamily
VNHDKTIPLDTSAGAGPASSIEVVLFDVGGVVALAEDPILLANLEAQLNLAQGGLPALLYQGDHWYDLSVGKMAEEVYWRILAQRVGKMPEELCELVSPIWGPVGQAGIDAAVIALVRLARERVRTAILSNATLALEQYLAEHGVADLFDPILNSARVGLRKPDPAVFHHALSVLGVAPGAVLFVDDKPRNTQVARELGIPSVDFTGADALAAALARYGIILVSK